MSHEYDEKYFEQFGKDLLKMIDLKKELGDQTEFVQKAIGPLLTWEWAYTKECMDDGYNFGNDRYKQHWETKYKENPNSVKEYILNEFNGYDLYGRLGGNDDRLTAVNKLKALGIEGERHGNTVDHVYDDEYVKSLDQELYYEEQQENYFNENDISDENNYENEFTLEAYIKEPENEWIQDPHLPIDILSHTFNEQNNDCQLAIAQKTGYVQGVCESVLAFNTDDNRKIMSEATMSFLSKKLLSEMNVTKDMAQKFANPETYKALEKCVFTPTQEQQLEQTQLQGIRR